MITLSYDQALDLLRAQVEKKGADYVYTIPEVEVEGDSFFGVDCRYFVDGQPSCIVGHVFADLGVSEQHVLEGSRPTQAAPDFVKMEDLKTEALLVVAQSYQDAGTPWGEAVEVAHAKTNKSKITFKHGAYHADGDML